MIFDTLIIKCDISGHFLEDDSYEIEIDSRKCYQIVSLNSGIKLEDEDDFLKTIDGKKVLAIYKGVSRIDDMKIFLLSPKQINRQIKLDQII
jgi:hypothetical protein